MTPGASKRFFGGPATHLEAELREDHTVKRNPMQWVAMVALGVLAGACVQSLDVGSNTAPILSTGAGGIDDLSGLDGSVPCGPECQSVDGGDPACAGPRTIHSAQEWEAFVQLGCTHFSGDLVVAAPDVTTLMAPVLQTVSGHLTVERNFALTSLNLPELTAVGLNVNLSMNQALASVSLPKLTTCGSMNINRTPALSTLDLAALTRVRANLYIVETALTDLRLPALTLVKVIFNVSNNPQLRQCAVDAVLHQLVSVPMVPSATDNNGTPNTCP